jgi:hypothetical protein
MKRFLIVAIVSLLWPASAHAQPVIDGRADVADGYGAALSTQNTNTQFGNATNGDAVNGGGGSEINQVFGRVSGGRLYVTIAGNLETNFNKMEVFIDSVAGGVNQIEETALPAGVDAFCCGGLGTTDGALQRMDGLTFDAGFNADYLLSFTHGYETVNPNGLPGERRFYASSAHYAELGEGTAGSVVAAGMQLAPRGLPNVLRFPGDYNDNGKVEASDYILWRKTLGQSVPRGSGADANGNQIVDAPDYNIWATRFNDGTTLADFPFTPENLANGVSEALIGPALPGLGQGELIDRNYALGAGGCTDDTGAGCIAGELEFALDVDPSEVGTNASSHRRFNNTIDLEMAFDNSNAVGVTGDSPYTTPTTGNPQDVTTGIEFSIPLSEIGNPTGNIRMTIFVNGGTHDYASNQWAGTGILDSNLGGNGFGVYTGDLAGVIMSDYPGDQFVTVANPGAGGGAAVPEPASIALVMFAGLALSGFARRR